MRRLVVASHNRKKAGEMTTILGRRFPGLEVMCLADFAGAPEPDETAADYAGNAAIKAESAARFTGEWCVADDAGLEIDALPGELGVQSKRFAGADTPFDEKIRRVLEALDGVPDSGRGARFRCFVAVAPPGMEGSEALGPWPRLFSADLEGVIAREPRGTGGFGYDPVFFVPALGRTLAELTPDEKHAVSHRGKVLAAVGDWLETSGLALSDSA